MLELQRTIQKPVSISGTGLHTGVSSNLTFKPAKDNEGIKFVRTDLGGKPEIPALVDFVVDISRGTTLGIGEAKVHTVEHVLAAVVGLEIDNIVIELDSMEPPVGDGSAMPFVKILQEAGIETQDSPKDYLVIDETIGYTDEENKVEIVALPLNDFRATVMVDYENPALGSQHTGMFNLQQEFVTEFAPCRTFCFLSEVEALADQGLIKGGNLDNGLVIVDREVDDNHLDGLSKKLGLDGQLTVGESGFLNDKTLKFRNEPVRHKLLDLLGDFALIGAPIKAQILAARPGHAANVEFAKKVRKLYQQKKIVKKYQFVKKEGVVFDINAIHRILPHRYPMLLIDKIVELEFDKKVVAIKNVTFNEQFFQGHFPGEPVMPGVLQVEALAQAGGALLLNSIDNPGEKLVFFMSINNVKFRKPVVPGDQLILEVELVQKKSRYFSLTGKAYVDNKLVSQADFMAAVMDRKDEN